MWIPCSYLAETLILEGTQAGERRAHTDHESFRILRNISNMFKTLFIPLQTFSDLSILGQEGREATGRGQSGRFLREQGHVPLLSRPQVCSGGAAPKERDEAETKDRSGASQRRVQTRDMQ